MRYNVLIILMLCSFIVKAQKSNTTFGLQYKPIIPASYFNSSDISKSQSSYHFNLTPRYSNSFGMVIRQKVNKTFSLETGLNYTQRNFSLAITNNTIGLNDHTLFGMRSYELPLQLLTYVRASEYWYLNVSFGLSYNVLASDIFSVGEEQLNNYYQNTYRANGGYNALLANVGMEHRTENKGHYYFGASLHWPWKAIGRIFPEYDDKTNSFNEDEKFYIEMEGNFVTIDIRYFFTE